MIRARKLVQYLFGNRKGDVRLLVTLNLITFGLALVVLFSR